MLDFGPGYNYETLYLELCLNPQEPITRQTQVKYDAKMPSISMTIYYFIHSFIFYGSTLVFLLDFKQTLMSFNLIFASLILFGLFTTSSLCDGKKSAKYL